MTFFCENWANLPIDKGFKDWMLNDSVPVYEDFLYERPFVNLALLDSATLEALSKMELPDREKSPPEPQLLLSGLPRGCPMRRRAFQVGE